MKQIHLLALLFFVSLLTSQAQRTEPYSPQRTYHVEEPGTLHKVLETEDIMNDYRIFYKENKGNRYATTEWYKSSFDNIKITGRINCHDIYYLTSCNKFEVIRGVEDGWQPGPFIEFLGKIDLSETTIIGNDSPYCDIEDKRINKTSENYNQHWSSPENDRIGAYAFHPCRLDKVIFPNSLKSIHEYALEARNTVIDTLVFGDSLQTFPLMSDTIVSLEYLVNESYDWDGAFHTSIPAAYCHYAYIEVSDKNPYLTSIDGSLYDKGATTLLRCHPEGISRSGFPETMTHIGNGVRAWSKNESLKMPPNVISIGHFGLSSYRNWNTETLIIPASLETIGEYGLTNCTNTHIILGENIKRIGYRAFCNWSIPSEERGNEMLYCLSPIPPEIGDEAFYSVFDNGSQTFKHKCAVVPTGSKVAYEQVPGIANCFKEIIEADDVMAYYQEQIPLGTDDVTSAKNRLKETGRYNLQGIRLKKPVPGINIVKYLDGTTRKVWIK